MVNGELMLLNRDLLNGLVYNALRAKGYLNDIKCPIANNNLTISYNTIDHSLYEAQAYCRFYTGG